MGVALVLNKKAVLLNALIIAAYVVIALFANGSWMMLGAFLLLAVSLRCAVFNFMPLVLPIRVEGLEPASLSFVLWNLFLGLLYAAVVIGTLWGLAHVWLSGVKFLVPLTAVATANQSLFPWRWPRIDADQSQEQKIIPGQP